MRTIVQTALKDRAYMSPLVIGVVLVIILLILGASNIRVSELQVPVRYSSFGITNFYREQWFYQFAFMAFGLIVFGLHALVSLKLYDKKNRYFAIAFQWLTVAILALTVITVAAIFQVAELV